MSRFAKSTAVAAMLLVGAAMAQAQNLVLPTESEASDAIVALMGIPKPSKLKLGTCIAAVDATYPGQVACTVSVTLGAATTETQMDFFHKGKKWEGQPSVSQDKLPFPDPKLH